MRTIKILSFLEGVPLRDDWKEDAAGRHATPVYIYLCFCLTISVEYAAGLKKGSQAIPAKDFLANPSIS